jgi:hypothetical protein
MGGTRLALLALSALAACQSEPSGPVSVPLADAASLHVIAVPTNDDWTGHIPLTTGHTVRMQLKLFTAAGREITPLAHPLEMSFAFAPPGLATSTVADSALLLFDTTPLDSAGTQGSLYVTLTEPATSTTKQFGPFFVLIHPAF